MDSQEIAVIEAKLIIDEAYGEMFCDLTPIAADTVADTLRGMEILIHASWYLHEQIPEMYTDIW